ncbi:hypothetical protein FB45DRAFT_1023806 [Roridomyces roridus]|uniref:Uncharacterized protein n=1 Tax=Roridomyces roridus TaxID=1738132 RepID=A0AAD7FRS3_9AGAR|nr:hypothetical protein FB45DRAFT_1023806 [Roridomyces roridus]
MQGVLVLDSGSPPITTDVGALNGQPLQFRPSFSDEQLKSINQFLQVDLSKICLDIHDLCRRQEGAHIVPTLPSVPLDFRAYTEQTILLLRYAQTKRSEEQEKVLPAIVFWVLANCRNKIHRRFRQIQPLLEALTLWRPAAYDVIPVKHILIPTDTSLETILVAYNIARSSDTTHTYIFSEGAAANWAAALRNHTEMIAYFLRQAADKSEDQVKWGILYTLLQDHQILLRHVVDGIGHLHSFDWAVSDVMRRTLGSNDGTEHKGRRVGDEELKLEEEEPMNLLPLLEATNLDKLPFHANFLLRRLASLSAWSTSVRQLVHNKAFRLTTHLDLRLLELPRQEVAHHEWKAVVEHWELPVPTTPVNEHGAVHCEAGIMASMVEGLDQEPSNVRDAFDALRTEYTNHIDSSEQSITIGIAKKSCPTCKLLAEVINKTREIKIDVQGSHTTFSPWVPPHWLPPDILEALEQRLMKIVLELVRDNIRVTTPSSSSTVNDEESSPPIPKMSSRALAWRKAQELEK